MSEQADVSGQLEALKLKVESLTKDNDGLVRLCYRAVKTEEGWSVYALNLEVHPGEPSFFETEDDAIAAVYRLCDAQSSKAKPTEG